MADESPKDEKTEEATPRRREEAREKGQVAQSQDLTAALMLGGALVAFFVGGIQVVLALAQETSAFTGRLAAVSLTDLGAKDAAALVSSAWTDVLPALAFMLAPMILLGFLTAYGQVGFRITPKALELEWNKLNPVSGAKRIVGPRGFVRVGQSALKLVLIASITIAVAVLQLPEIASLAHMELEQSLYVGSRIIGVTAASAVFAIALLSIVDLLFQRFQHEKDLRMTKQEVKQDWKNTQGDPEIKRRIRQVQREMSARRMMDDVPKSTVVVTNPTHYAVALWYEKGPDGEPLSAAPKVVAKGVDALAQRIKEVARESEVPLYEDVPLARALHARCEIGDLVPVELFEAVATVIRHVYGLRTAASGRAR
ncbi:MAG: flagellar biosynthesis protein FlhB [Planctomycetota bacterium]